MMFNSKIPHVFCASIATETNSFSAMRCDLSDFKESFYAPPGEHPATPTLCSAVFTEARKRVQSGEIQLTEGTACWAEPGGLINPTTWVFLRDQLLNELEAAMPVDIVLLGLHGAMLAYGTLDPEGELIASVRKIIGPDAILGVTFDPHSHLSAQRIEHADIVTVFKEFPHTDFVRTGADCVRLSLDAYHGRIKPTISVFDVRMIDVLPTDGDPMRSFVDDMLATEASGEALSLSLIHGFLAGDSPDLGAKMIVITDDNQEKACALAQKFGERLFANRGKTRHNYLDIDTALQKAQAAAHRPVVIADVWDNPGGGVAGDSTILLEAMRSRGIQNAALAPLWDPMAVRLCHAAGENVELELRFGGKTSSTAGAPIDANVRVLKNIDNATQSFGDSIVPLGMASVILMDGIEIVLTSNRAQAFDPDLFTNHGIDALQKDILVVKSTNHFYGAFSKIAHEVIYTAVEGIYPDDARKTPYKNLTRQIWPIVDTPFER